MLIVKKYSLDADRRKEILNEIENFKRILWEYLALLYRNISEEVAMEYEQGTLENDLVFTGFVGIRDPLRPRC